MIPKIIHYCWFGRNEKSDLVKKCIASWYKYYPDYQIIEWNEDNFDYNKDLFTKEAYENKKWAFVSDVARLYALINMGGFYMDTDVEVFDSGAIDCYLDYENVLVFENERRVATGLFCGCEKGSKFFKDLLAPYDGLSYNGEYEQINTILNTPIIKETYPSLKWNDKTQEINSTIIISSNEYGKTMKHYGEHTWLDNKVEYRVSSNNGFKKFLRNPKIFKKLENSRFLHIYEFMVYDLLDLGIIYFIKRKFIKKKS